MEDFFRHFRSFLGLPKYDSPNYHQEDERNSNDFDESRYDAFSDPFEMHRYFEHQMNKILRNFDIFEFGKNESLFGDFPESNGIEFFDKDQLPPIEKSTEGCDLRNQFLKPGYERPTRKQLVDRSDKDLDESKISIGDLDSVVTGKFFKSNEEQPKVTTRFFGKSISTKTVMNPDGSMEIHKTIRDNQGNEETTITKKVGDKEHTVTKKRDSSGKEEVIESFINIDDNDSLPDHSQNKPWSLFDKFFK